MSSSWKIKVKTANGFTSQKTLRSGDNKMVSQLVTSSIKDDVTVMIAKEVEETVRQHNERVITQAAIFFQRVVTRTPKDETYYDPNVKVFHKADDDYVWKHWTIKYWRRSLTAEEIGAKYFESEKDFNNKAKIQAIADIIKDKLFNFKSYDFEHRPTRIKGIRFENTHPRFAQLEYGMYEWSDTVPKKGSYKGHPSKHYHGIQNHASVQAPYGMYRITQAEMESMSIEDYDAWSSRTYKSDMREKDVIRVPSKEQIKKLREIIGDKTHLSDSDIDAVTKVWGAN